MSVSQLFNLFIAWEEAVSLILMCIIGADLALSILSVTSVPETLK